MIALFRQYYEAMQTDISLVQKKGLEPALSAECCFQVAVKYWQELKKKIKVYVFKSVEEEIHFYKKIKPLFISEIEFHSLVYYVEYFVPLREKERISFWERESNRLQIFISKNAPFYEYYKEQRTDKDDQWFVRSEMKEEGITNRGGLYGEDTGENHGFLVAQLLSLELYDGYVRKKLETIGKVK